MAINTGTALGSQAVLLVLGLLATAVLVRALGAARFGAWGLVTAIGAYASLLDLGLGVALVRRIATARADGDDESVGAAVAAGLAATLAIGVTAAAVVVALAPALGGWLNVPADGMREFVGALRIVGLAAGASLPGVVFGAVPTAAQRLDSVIRMETFVLASVLVAQIAAVISGAGLVVLGWIFAAGRLASLAGRAALAGRHLRWGRVRLRAGFAFWSELGRFGALKVVHQGASQFVLYLDRLLVGAFLSVQAVAFYTVAVDLAHRLLVVPGSVSAAYYPAGCAVAGDRAAFSSLYERTSRTATLLALPLAVVLVVLAGPILAVWVGAEFSEGATQVLRVVAVAYGLMALTAVPAAAADARDRPGISARYGVMSVLVNAALAVLLIPALGVVGGGLALLGGVALLMPFFVSEVNRSVADARDGRYFLRALAAPALPALVLGVVLAAALASGLPTPVRIATGAVAGTAAYVWLVRRLRLVDADQVRFVAGLPGGRMLQRLVGNP